jgi:hypothetical protein
MEFKWKVEGKRMLSETIRLHSSLSGVVGAGVEVNLLLKVSLYVPTLCSK